MLPWKTPATRIVKSDLRGIKMSAGWRDVPIRADFLKWHVGQLWLWVALTNRLPGLSSCYEILIVGLIFPEAGFNVHSPGLPGSEA